MISFLTSQAGRRFLVLLLVLLAALTAGFIWGNGHATRRLTPQIDKLTLELERERGARTAEKLAAEQVARLAATKAAQRADSLGQRLLAEQQAHKQAINQLKGKSHAAAKPIAFSADECRFGPEFISLWNSAYHLSANSHSGEASPADSADAASGTGKTDDR